MRRISWLVSLVLIGVLAPCGWQRAFAGQRVVGAVAPNGGAHLIKHFSVSAGTELRGFEFLSNDLRTTFPRVAILRGPISKLSEGEVLLEVRNVKPSGHHRVSVSFASPLSFAAAQEIYVAVALPPSSGIREVTDGAGLAVNELSGPPNSYFVMSATGHLGEMDTDFAMELLLMRPGKTTADKNPVSREHLPQVRIHPTPFNPSTTIEFSVPELSPVTLVIFDVAGREVRTLLEEALGPGSYAREWHGTDTLERRVSAGIYVVRLTVGDVTLRRKLVMVN